MASVKDVDLARRAVQRGLLTENQIREAREFAAGGRSVLSVLLDLGHLKPDDLLALGDAPVRLRSNRVFWIATFCALGVAVVAALALAAGGRPSAPLPLPPPTILATPFADSLASRVAGLLQGVERSLDASGRPPASRIGELRRAGALLEELMAERSRAEDVASLGRVRELLDEWELAREAYARAVALDPAAGPALLGAARLSLLLQDPAAARDFARRACERPSPPAEAYYLRGAAAHALGEATASQEDLATAARLDPAYAPRVRELLGRRSGSP